jgi:hypothetical protein
MIFGPTFGSEVIAAGLGGLPICWGDDGQLTSSGLTDAQQATLAAVAAAHDPTKKIVPQSISALQARRSLRAKGLYDSVVALVHGAAAVNPDVQDSFDYGDPWHRDASWIAKLAPAMNPPLSDADVDSIFILGATL